MPLLCFEDALQSFIRSRGEAWCAGGTSIEDLAEKYPEKIIKIPVDIFEGITDAQANEMVEGLQIKGDKQAAVEQIKALYKCFTDSDCTMVEVSIPMPVSHDQRITSHVLFKSPSMSPESPCNSLVRHCIITTGCSAFLQFFSASPNAVLCAFKWLTGEACHSGLLSCWGPSETKLAEMLSRHRGFVAGQSFGRDKGWQTCGRRCKAGF